MPKPDLSVVLIHYRRKRFLETSLLAISNQTLSKNKYEVIVADDGTPEGVQDIVDKFSRIMNIRAIVNTRTNYEEFRNPAPLRNMGIRESRGDVILMHSADLVPCYRNTMKRILKIHSNQKLLLTGILYNLNQKETELAQSRSFDLHKIIHQKINSGSRHLVYGSRSFRKSVSGSIGGFSEIFKGWGGEDTDFEERVQRYGVRMLCDKSIVYVHLFHEETEHKHYEKIFNLARVNYIRDKGIVLAVHSGDAEALKLRGKCLSDRYRSIQLQKIDSGGFKLTGSFKRLPNSKNGPILQFTNNDLIPICGLMLNNNNICFKQYCVNSAKMIVHTSGIRENNRIEIYFKNRTFHFHINGGQSAMVLHDGYLQKGKLGPIKYAVLGRLHPWESNDFVSGLRWGNISLNSTG